MALSILDIIKKGATGIVDKGKSFLNAPDNSTSGLIRNTITGIPKVSGQAFKSTASYISPTRKVSVRPAFGKEEKEVYGGGLAKIGLDIPARTMEAVPRGIITAGAEIDNLLRSEKKEEYTVPFLNMKRLGFEKPKYESAYGETKRRIVSGENPWLAALNIASNKTLDVAFGAQLLSDLNRVVASKLTKPGFEKTLASWEMLGKPKTPAQAKSSYRNLVKQLDASLKATPAQRETLTVLNNAKRILDKEGLPKLKDIVRYRASQAAELVGRESPTIGQAFQGLDITPLRGVRTPLYGLPTLPGAVAEDATTPAAGLSIRRIRPVGSKASQEVEERALSLEFKADALRDSPFTINAKTNRFLVNKEGTVKNLADIRTKRTAGIYENTMKEAGYSDPDKFVEDFENYLTKKRELNQEIKEFNESITGAKKVEIPNSLAEAKKYKSAEEYVKGQERLFHGTTKENPTLNKGVVSLAKDYYRARDYAEAGGTMGRGESKVIILDETGEKIRVAKNPVVDEFFVPDREKVLKLGSWNKANNVARETPVRDYTGEDWILKRDEFLQKYPDVVQKKPEDMEWIEAEKVFVQGKLQKSEEFQNALREFEEVQQQFSIGDKEWGRSARKVDMLDKQADREIGELLVDAEKGDKEAIEKLNEYRADLPKIENINTPEALADARVKGESKVIILDETAETVSPEERSLERVAEQSNEAFDIPETDEEIVIREKSDVEKLKNPTPPPNTNLVSIKESDFENWVPREISGVAGGKSLNIRDAMFSVGNKSINQAAKTGWPAPVKVYYNYHLSEASKTAFVRGVEDELSNVVSKLSKKEQQALANHRLDGKALPKDLERANAELTKVTDKIRDIYNSWAKSVGQPEISYAVDYLPRVAQASDDVIVDPKNFSDFFTKERVGGEIQFQERDLGKLLARYVSAVSNKMYMEGATQQLSELGSVLNKRYGLTKSARFIDDFLKDLKDAGGKDLLSNIARSVISARSTAALSFNPVWSLTVQPASFVLTVARNSGFNVIPSTINGLKPTDADWRWLSSLPTYRIKVLQTLSRTGIGDIGSGGIKPKIGSRRARIDRALGFVGDSVEEFLSRNAAFIARDFGIKRGLTGKDLDIYADLQIGATQSEYTKSARPAALRPLMVRFFAPFQTYSFEAYRFGKTILGLPGGLPLEKKDRIVSLLVFISGMYLYDWLQSQVTGRKISSLGSVLPIVGNVVDWTVAKVTGNRQRMGRTPVAPISEVESFADAFRRVYVDGNWEPLRKEAIKWGMGFAGVGGASQANRLVDGLIANARGYQVTKGGDIAFRVVGVDKVLAPILGPYSTGAGKEYVEGGFKPIGEEIKTEKELAQEVLDKVRSGEFGSEAVAEEYFNEELKKIERARKEERMNLAPKEYAKEILNRIKSGKMTEAEAEKEFETYERQAESSESRTEEVVRERSESFMKWKVARDWSKAFVIDPSNTWKALTDKEKLGIVEGNLVEMRRFEGINYKLPGGSEEYKRKAMAQLGIPWSDRDKYKLEHIVPVKSGGDSRANNLKIVTNKQHDSYTKWDNAANRAVQSGGMTRKEVAEIAIKLKMDKSITLEEALNELKK